ncbi:hypothetical protein AMATHDRAFT_1079 [Amanita thiersii Skay4041]|uniref:DUF7727 domain-containing protein n=1 Tax=Amanita thiersii Skay4041 TaxID=703135 RepID=A0A2A9NZ93_9AGAR|nr:hypothetical protein AMATHDRAFT_1079 [Amanita thiersii Skay4041]
MGNLIWHVYARFVSITASVYAFWAGFWGLFYRKFFWDFVGGIVRDPGGIQPSPNAVLVKVIVKAPVIQILAMLLGLFLLALEFPLPQLKPLGIYRSLPLRVVLLFFQSFLTILFYQGTNASIWSLIALLCYSRAIAQGEKMAEAKQNREKGGGV